MLESRLITMALACSTAVTFPASADDSNRGEEVYKETCLACHGVDGAGSFPGVPDLTEKAGPLSKDNAVLLKRMAEGFQSPGSPMAMPARGGNRELTDADLAAALKYMRRQFLQTK